MKRPTPFLFPSFREPSGGVLLEAMTHSLPIITCAYGGPNSIVDDSCGIRIPPLNENQYADELSKAITLLANDPEKRKSLSDGAANRAKGFFGWDTKRKRIAKIYEEVINAGPLS